MDPNDLGRENDRRKLATTGSVLTRSRLSQPSLITLGYLGEDNGDLVKSLPREKD